MTVIEALDESMNIICNLIITGNQARQISRVLDLLSGTKAALIEPDKEKKKGSAEESESV